MFYPYHHFHFILIFGFSVGIFYFFGEHQIEFKEEHPSLPTLSDQLLWIPDMEGVLEDYVTEEIDWDITAVKQGQMKCVVGLKHSGNDRGDCGDRNPRDVNEFSRNVPYIRRRPLQGHLQLECMSASKGLISKNPNSQWSAIQASAFSEYCENSRKIVGLQRQESNITQLFNCFP